MTSTLSWASPEMADSHSQPVKITGWLDVMREMAVFLLRQRCLVERNQM